MNWFGLSFKVTDNGYTNTRGWRLRQKLKIISDPATALLDVFLALGLALQLCTSDPKQSRGGIFCLRGWCNIPDTWQHPHLSHTNPLVVPKNTVYPQHYYHPSLLWKLMYCTCADLMGTCCVVVICTVKVPSRFIHNSGMCQDVSGDENCLNFLLMWECDVLRLIICR